MREGESARSGAGLCGVIEEEVDQSEHRTDWRNLWADFFKTPAIRELSQATTTTVIHFAVDTLPIAIVGQRGAASALLASIERLFGDSPSDLAKILRVSRPMIYHYRQGMEPIVEENRRRLRTLADLAGGFAPLVTQPIKPLLKVWQPEGCTLLEFLSEEHLNVPALQQVLLRNIRDEDQRLRVRLAAELNRKESDEERRDIIQERHAEGKPVYVGDPDEPGALFQIQPGGRRVRGRMVKRKFVPDEK